MRLVASAPWVLLTAACGQTIYLGDLTPFDGGSADAGVFDADTGVPERDGGVRDGGVLELSGRYMLVVQTNPARVICTVDLESLTEVFEMRTAMAAGLADGMIDLFAYDEAVTLSGPAIEMGFSVPQLFLTRDVRRPEVFTTAVVGQGMGPGGTTLEVVIVQMEIQDPESGVHRGAVQHKLEDRSRTGECTVDYQITFYACGVGC